jgi:hypothetical protein
MDHSIMIRGECGPWYRRRWWLKAEPLPPFHPNVLREGAALRVPWWAWPFELTHRLFFGRIKLD